MDTLKISVSFPNDPIGNLDVCLGKLFKNGTNMWIMTQHGFYSIVTSKERKGFQIRALVLQDIENARILLGDDELEVITTSQADYRYRITVSKEQLGRFMNHILMHIDYSNFKERIHKKADQKNKVEAYYSVWSTMSQLQK